MVLLEYVTQETVLLRHPNMTETIRHFFADAGSNSVRAFYDEESGLGGYVFHVIERTMPGGDSAGKYYRFVATMEVVDVQQGSEELKRIRPTQRDAERIHRQFANNEWFSGPFLGRLDRVAAAPVEP